MNQSVKNVLIMSIVISDEYGKRVDYGKYKFFFVFVCFVVVCFFFDNAQALCSGLTKRGIRIVSGKTEKMFTFQSRIRKKFTV